MKTNRFFTVILSVTLCVNFVSCGGDDDNNKIVDPENVAKRVVTCTKEKTSYIISYDNGGNVSKIVCQNNGESYDYDFSFSGNEAVATSEEKDGSYTYIDNIKFSLNENGYCTSVIWTAIEKGNTTYESTDNYKFVYNSENQVTKADIDGEIEEYVYRDGVMISSGVAEIITYTDIPNIGNLFVAFTTNYNDPFEEWRLAGLLGKASRFLPKMATWNEGMETYDYELDEEGYVKTVNVTFRNTNGQETVSSYKYTYESIK